jgi:hypothetical protein
MAQSKRKPASPAADAKSKPKSTTNRRTKPAAKATSSSASPNPIELPEGMCEQVAARSY